MWRFLPAIAFSITVSLVLSESTRNLWRRSADDPLPKECNNESFILPEGSYQVLSMIVKDNYGDEGEELSITCQLDHLKNFKQCDKWLRSISLENTTLKINDSVVKESDNFTKNYDKNSREMTFSSILSYDLHNGTYFKCVLKPGLGDSVLVSANSDPIGVDELHIYTITQTQKQQIVIGKSLALTCKADSERAFERMSWSVEGGTIGAKEYNGSGIDDAFQWTEEKNKLALTSILTVTAENQENFKSPVEYKFYCFKKYDPNNFHDKQDKYDAEVIVELVPVDYSIRNGLIVAAVFTMIIVAVSFALYIRRRRRIKSAIDVAIRKMETMNAIKTHNQYTKEQEGIIEPMLMTINSIMDRIKGRHSAWEKDKKTIIVKAQIGEGNFGVVLLGTMPNEFGINQTVAIKTIKEQGLEVTALLDFEKEIEMMTKFRHKNIVNLLGICTVTLPFYIIMEYMCNGQMNTYLNQFAPTKENPIGGLTICQLAWMCQQPCDALEYLSSNDVVHRDVSARNCLVGENLQVKLADFGLSRDTNAGKNYYKKEGGLVPVKWMAPEALKHGKYTIKNDVWAFGILAWEVFSFGALPYAHLTNQQVMVDICAGVRLERPHMCPSELWEKILGCWKDDPDERIGFGMLLAFLAEHASVRNKGI